jgi:uncharacterized protein
VGEYPLVWRLAAEWLHCPFLVNSAIRVTTPIQHLRQIAATFLALLAFLALWPAQAQDLPTDRLLRSLQPTADVNDFAGILKPSERDALEQRCKELREKTGAQLAVVTLKSLEGGQVDDFAVKLFQRWGIGDKDKKNGLLLLVAIQDRKARIEVGYGLEPILPDALAGRILNEQLFPAFRQQRYADGLTAAVNRIIEIVEKNEPAPVKPAQPHIDINPFFIGLVFPLLFIAIGAFSLGAGLRGSRGCQLPMLIPFIAIPFMIGWALASPWAPLLHTFVGFICAWLGWQTGRPGRRRRRNWNWGTDTWTWPTGGGYSGGGWSGGSFSGGSSSWGGFGGGSSGGGGASGGW